MSRREQALDGEEVERRLAALPGWVCEGGMIKRRYHTGGWRVSLMVANAVGFICEGADHHADLLVTWPEVTVSLVTHSAGGITAKDFEVARLIEAHLTWAPEVGSALTGPSQPLAR